MIYLNLALAFVLYLAVGIVALGLTGRLIGERLTHGDRNHWFLWPFLILWPLTILLVLAVYVPDIHATVVRYIVALINRIGGFE